MLENSLKRKELGDRTGIYDTPVSEPEQNDELMPIEVRIPFGLGLTGSDEQSETKIATGEPRRGSPWSRASPKEIISRKASRSKSKFSKVGTGLQVLGANSTLTSKRILEGASYLIIRKPTSKKPKKSPKKKQSNPPKSSSSKPKPIPFQNFGSTPKPKTPSPAFSQTPAPGRKTPNLEADLTLKFGSNRRPSLSQQQSSDRQSNSPLPNA